jgi:hypothetical protein
MQTSPMGTQSSKECADALSLLKIEEKSRKDQLQYFVTGNWATLRLDEQTTHLDEMLDILIRNNIAVEPENIQFLVDNITTNKNSEKFLQIFKNSTRCEHAIQPIHSKVISIIEKLGDEAHSLFGLEYCIDWIASDLCSSKKQGKDVRKVFKKLNSMKNENIIKPEHYPLVWAWIDKLLCFYERRSGQRTCGFANGHRMKRIIEQRAEMYHELWQFADFWDLPKLPANFFQSLGSFSRFGGPNSGLKCLVSITDWKRMSNELVRNDDCIQSFLTSNESRLDKNIVNDLLFKLEQMKVKPVERISKFCDIDFV